MKSFVRANRYDPDKGPDLETWSALDEADQIRIVQAYHRRHRVQLPKARVHATVHVVVENQLAIPEPVVVETFTRLRGEGLNRHEAIHAIGMVLVGQIHAILTGKRRDVADVNEPYFEELKSLTAEIWRDSG